MRAGIDRAENTAAALAMVEEAARGGAAFVATPEMTNAVDQNAKRLLSALRVEDDLSEVRDFAAAAKAHNIWLLAGSFAVKLEERRAANRAFLFSPDGAIAARYDKLHMFDVELANGETWKESNVYRPGERAVIAQTPLAAIGLSICYDVRFPHLYRALAQQGAEILCVPAAFTAQTGRAHWKTLLTARAIETGSFVVAPAQGGVHEDGRSTYGHSMVIGPWGDLIAERENDTPGVLFAEIDPAESAKARRQIPNLALEQEFEITILKQ